MRPVLRWGLGCAVLAAAVGLVVGVWLPAEQSRRDAAWQRAGERALSRLALPGSFVGFSTHTEGHLTSRCVAGTQRCYVSDGDPSADLGAVRTAFADLATGSMRSRCWLTPLPHSPMSCSLEVPVAGSRLVAVLFARPVDDAVPLAQRGYHGSYVQIDVQSRG